MFLRVTNLLGSWCSGRALQVFMHTIQQPEKELQGIMLGIASELRAILGNCILKEKKENQRVSLALPTTKSGPTGSRSTSSHSSALPWDNVEIIRGEKWSFLWKPPLLEQCPKCYKVSLYRRRHFFFQERLLIYSLSFENPQGGLCWIFWFCWSSVLPEALIPC